ncbi:hypothetical protein K438DRAFT_1757864 [Mycena galopus ATCC 62051]|nr:hypothetical protein K438DRAFT_1757864 [Mycena galopus ATCC 62051]
MVIGMVRGHPHLQTSAHGVAPADDRMSEQTSEEERSQGVSAAEEKVRHDWLRISGIRRRTENSVIVASINHKTPGVRKGSTFRTCLLPLAATGIMMSYALSPHINRRLQSQLLIFESTHFLKQNRMNSRFSAVPTVARQEANVIVPIKQQITAITGEVAIHHSYDLKLKLVLVLHTEERLGLKWSIRYNLPWVSYESIDPVKSPQKAFEYKVVLYRRSHPQNTAHDDGFRYVYTTLSATQHTLGNVFMLEQDLRLRLEGLCTDHYSTYPRFWDPKGNLLSKDESSFQNFKKALSKAGLTDQERFRWYCGMAYYACRPIRDTSVTLARFWDCKVPIDKTVTLILRHYFNMISVPDLKKCFEQVWGMDSVKFKPKACPVEWNDERFDNPKLHELVQIGSHPEGLYEGWVTETDFEIMNDLNPEKRLQAKDLALPDMGRAEAANFNSTKQLQAEVTRTMMDQNSILAAKMMGRPCTQDAVMDRRSIDVRLPFSDLLIPSVFVSRLLKSYGLLWEVRRVLLSGYIVRRSHLAALTTSQQSQMTPHNQARRPTLNRRETWQVDYFGYMEMVNNHMERYESYLKRLATKQGCTVVLETRIDYSLLPWAFPYTWLAPALEYRWVTYEPAGGIMNGETTVFKPFERKIPTKFEVLLDVFVEKVVFGLGDATVETTDIDDPDTLELEDENEDEEL